jgi:hypothetical protein
LGVKNPRRIKTWLRSHPRKKRRKKKRKKKQRNEFV